MVSVDWTLRCDQDGHGAGYARKEVFSATYDCRRQLSILFASSRRSRRDRCINQKHQYHLTILLARYLANLASQSSQIEKLPNFNAVTVCTNFSLRCTPQFQTVGNQSKMHLSAPPSSPSVNIPHPSLSPFHNKVTAKTASPGPQSASSHQTHPTMSVHSPLSNQPTPTYSRPTNNDQLSTNLPGLIHHVTGHTPSGAAIVYSSNPAQWTNLNNNTLSFNVIYTTSHFPPSLTHNADLATHDALLASKQLGLTNPSGTVARMVDFAPGSEPVMHRTQSLDYGIVVEGEVEMVLDDGVKRVLRRGDVAVQRCTRHGWRNVSGTEWARMFFVLQGCEKLVVGGREMGEDVGAAGEAGERH